MSTQARLRDLAAAAGNDEGAWKELVELLTPALETSLRELVSPPADVEEWLRQRIVIEVERTRRGRQQPDLADRQPDRRRHGDRRRRMRTAPDRRRSALRLTPDRLAAQLRSYRHVAQVMGVAEPW